MQESNKDPEENLIIGKAHYIGHSDELLGEFGYGYHTLYNSEGNYVRSKDGQQVLTNRWDWVEVIERN